MRLAQDDEMVHTLAPDRSDQPFDKAILPRRGWCGRLVPDAHGAQSARDDAAIDPVAIADEVVRSLILRVPTKPAMHSNLKPAGYSDRKPATLGVNRMGRFDDVVEG